MPGIPKTDAAAHSIPAPYAATRGHWLPPPETLTLEADDIHLWRIPLSAPQAQVQRLTQSLSDEERTRAGTFCFPHLYTRFVVGRARLRQVLGRYTGVAPERLIFQTGPYGKPHLAEGQNSEGLQFNFSNSADLALCGVTVNREIGVDLEFRRPTQDCEAIAERFFTPREAEQLRQLTPDPRLKAFFHTWTCKEAFLKLIGKGLHFDLNHIEVCVYPDQPARVLRVKGRTEDLERWTLLSINPDTDFAGAVVVEGPIGRLALWRCDTLEAAEPTQAPKQEDPDG